MQRWMPRVSSEGANAGKPYSTIQTKMSRQPQFKLLGIVASLEPWQHASAYPYGEVPQLSVPISYSMKLVF